MDMVTVMVILLKKQQKLQAESERMIDSTLKKEFRQFAFLCLIFFVSFSAYTPVFAKGPYQRIARIIDIPEYGSSNLHALIFNPDMNSFIRLTPSGLFESKLSYLSFSGEIITHRSLDISLVNPLNVSFNHNSGELYYYDNRSNDLIKIKFTENGFPINSSEGISHTNIQHPGLRNVQGITIDPNDGELIVLDADIPRIVRLAPNPARRFEKDSRFTEDSLMEIPLPAFKDTELRGITIRPEDGHFFITCPAEKRLYELNNVGEIINWRDLNLWKYTNTTGLIMAPSGDQTDDPENTSIYIVDSGPQADKAQIIELALIEPTRLDLSHITVLPKSYRILQPNPGGGKSEPSDPRIEAIEVNTINAYLWDPPSPDPAGMAYYPPSDNLLMSDSEVNEMPIFQDANIFELTFSGTLLNTFNSLSFSNEPTGIAWNPNNGHFFISDDSGDHEIMEVYAGIDGIIGTGDDIVTSFLTTTFGSDDPEGITFDTWQGTLFMADGVNAEIYEIAPGNNGVFDGAPPDGDDVIDSFDTASLGLDDPEGVEFNRDTGHLYIVSGSNDVVVETDRSGNAVRVIDVSFLNALAMAGIAYAPNSDNQATNSLYISDRGVDNNNDPDENDGLIYEITDEDISLPVELASFTVETVGKHVWLEWKTESELENVGFEIYRSEIENENYDLISSYVTNKELEGLGNSSIGHLYSYTDESVLPGNTYWYKIADIDINGRRTFHEAVSVTVSSNFDYPSDYYVHSNYPNPFNPSTIIKYQLPVTSEIEISIFNSQGRQVMTLFSGVQTAGEHQVEWNASGFASGVYVYQFITKSGFVQSRKLILLK
jgi:hypothetical protein